MATDLASISNVTITATDKTASAWESLRANAKRTEDQFQSFANGLTGPFNALHGLLATLGTTLGAIKFLDFLNQTAAATAELKRMSEVTGATVDGLADIRAIAKLSDTDMQLVSSSLQKLAKGMAGADDTTKGFGFALKQLSLSAKDSQGSLKTTDQMLLDIALKFNQYADGPAKTAAAIALLGKQGAQMLPLLKDMAEQAEIFGARTEEEKERLKQLTEQADEYEKNLKRLQVTKTAALKLVALEFIPVMDSFVKALLGAKNETGGLIDKVKEMAKDGTLREWAEKVALGIAFVVDQFDLFYRIFQTVGKAIGGGIGIFQGLAEALIAAGEAMSGQWVSAGTRIRSSFTLIKESAIGAYEDIRNVWSKATFGDRLRAQLEADRKAIASLPKPELKFDTSKDGKEVADGLLKRLDLIKSYYAQVKAADEADYALFKAQQDARLTAVKDNLALRLISEREAITQESALRIEQAQANLARISKEKQDAIAEWHAMYAELGNITEQDAEKRSKLLDSAIIKMGEVVTRATKLAGDERVAREGVNASIRQGTVALELYNQRLRDFARDSQYAAQDFVTQLNDATGAEQAQLSLLGASSLQQAQFNAQLQYANQLRDLKIRYDREIDKLQEDELAKGVIIAEQYMTQRDAVIARREAHLKILPQLEEERQRVEALRAAWQAIDAAAFDVFKSIFEHGTDTWKRLTQSLKDTLIRALYEMTVKRWVLSIFADIAGPAGAGIVQGATQGGVSGAIGSLFGGAGSSAAGSYLAGLFGAGSTTAAGAAGVTGTATFAGSLANTGATGVFAEGAGALGAEAAAGAQAGALAAGASWVPVVGWIVAIAALAYGIFSANKEPTPARGGLSFTGPFEDNVPATQTAFGAVGFGDAQTQQFSGAVGKAMTDAIGALLDLGAKQLKPETVDAITKQLHDTVLLSFEGTFTTEDFINKFGPQMARQLLDPVLEAVDPYARQLVDAFDGPLDKLLAYAGDILTVTGLLSEKGDDFKRLFGESINLEALDKARHEGESFGAALGRVAQEFLITNQIATLMGKTQEQVWGAIGLASSEAREQLIQFAGGVDKLNASLASYYDHYYTADEKLKQQHDALSASFTALGETMPTTLAGFRTLVENIVNGVNPALTLQTEAGAKEYAGLLALEGQFYAFITATQQAEQGTAGLTDQIDRAGTAVNDFGTRMDDFAARFYGSNWTPGTPMPGRGDLYDWRASHPAGGPTAEEIAAAEAAAKALEAAVNSAGLSLSTLASAISKGMTEGNLGETLGNTLATGIETALRNQAADRIAQIFYDSLVTPIIQTILVGGNVAQTISTLNIEAMVENASKVADALTQVFEDPAFMAAMDKLREGMNKLGQSMAATAATAAQDGTFNAGFEPPFPGAIWISSGGNFGYWAPGPNSPNVVTPEVASTYAADLAKTQRQLAIDLQRALGNDDLAQAMERADAIAALREKWGTDADALIATQQAIWDALDATKLREATEAWVKTLQDFQRSLTLDSTLSPLTVQQRFAAAASQYTIDLAAAQAGNIDARGRFTSDAQAYLREALAMFGRASSDYNAIYQRVVANTQGLIDAGLAPTAPATIADVYGSLQSGQEADRRDWAALLTKMDTLNDRVDKLSRETERGNAAAQRQTDDLVGATTDGSVAISNAVARQSGARLA